MLRKSGCQQGTLSGRCSGLIGRVANFRGAKEQKGRTFEKRSEIKTKKKEKENQTGGFKRTNMPSSETNIEEKENKTRNNFVKAERDCPSGLKNEREMRQLRPCHQGGGVKGWKNGGS